MSVIDKININNTVYDIGADYNNISNKPTNPWRVVSPLITPNMFEVGNGELIFTDEQFDDILEKQYGILSLREHYFEEPEPEPEPEDGGDEEENSEENLEENQEEPQGEDVEEENEEEEEEEPVEVFGTDVYSFNLISMSEEDATYIVQLGDSGYYTSVILYMSKSFDENEQQYIRQANLSYDTIYFTNLLTKSNTFFPDNFDLSQDTLELSYGDAAQIYNSNYQIFNIDYWTGDSDTYYYFYLDYSSKPYEDYDGEAYVSYSMTIGGTNVLTKYTYTIRHIPEHEEEQYNPETGETETITVPENYIQTFVKNTIDTTGIQTTSNLVTSLSSQSTDTQYPSAKCVYDLIGDVETLLNNINSGGVV